MWFCVCINSIRAQIIRHNNRKNNNNKTPVERTPFTFDK